MFLNYDEAALNLLLNVFEKKIDFYTVRINCLFAFKSCNTFSPFHSNSEVCIYLSPLSPSMRLSMARTGVSLLHGMSHSSASFLSLWLNSGAWRPQ